MATTLSASQAARIPLILSITGAPATTDVTVKITHPNGSIEAIDVTTDATGSALVAVVPLGSGTATADVFQTVQLASVSGTIS